VRDDGVGLPSATRPGKTGIGLANTRARLEKFTAPTTGLTLTSEPGRGVTVHIELPCRRCTSTATLPVRPLPPRVFAPSSSTTNPLLAAAPRLMLERDAEIEIVGEAATVARRPT